MSTNVPWLNAARELLKSANGGETPLVVDPFAGGGSIPLEALRMECDAFASDLNPVACLILRALLDDIPRLGDGLKEKFSNAGADIGKRALEALRDVYPEDPDGCQPFAYFWARTVRCEAPKCGAEIPIFKSAWLSKAGSGKARFFRENKDGDCTALVVDRAPKGGPVVFRVARGEGSEEAKSGFRQLAGTKQPGNSANVICPCCGAILPGQKSNPRTQMQLAAQKGGADPVFDKAGRRIGGAMLLAVATRSKSGPRSYRLPSASDYGACRKAASRLRELSGIHTRDGVSLVPDEPLPPIGTLGFRVQRYGMLHWGDLFSTRQKLAMATLLSLLRTWRGDEQNERVHDLLALALSRVAMCGMSLTKWNAHAEKMQHVFGMQALPFVWDFAEVVPIFPGPGAWPNAVDLICSVAAAQSTVPTAGQVALADASKSPLPDSACSLWFTDPPYYDAVPYADLSDFFFVWLKRMMPDDPLMRDPFDPSNPLTPKIQEAIQDDNRSCGGQPKDRRFFEKKMAQAFSEGHRILADDGIACVVFAHKTTEGWEALLTGIVQAGWTITASWPISTEMRTRLRARESAALATSVHLICRPRVGEEAGDWDEVRRRLPGRVHEWMERLQKEKVRGADLVFACIGPALELYSKYSKVVDAEDREIPLGGDPESKEPYKRGYLAYVWEAVARAALERVLGVREGKATNHAAGALEEDARLTALFLWTLQSTNGNGDKGGADSEQAEEDDSGEAAETPRKAKRGFSLIFDVARRFAQPLGIHLDEWEHRLIETEKGVVRLMSIDERAKVLFGEETAGAIAGRIEDAAKRNPQMMFDFITETDRAAVPTIKGGHRTKQTITDDDLRSDREATTLDRVHAAMLLQKGGRSNALRALLKAEQERGPDFLRLANSLSALYPKDCEEKRLLDAMLLAAR
jgi:adenine-specific DNA methylase